MKTVKICNVKARAERLSQIEMVEAYRELALNDDTNEVVELTEADHAELNSRWNERGQSAKPATRKPCKNCRGL